MTGFAFAIFVLYSMAHQIICCQAVLDDIFATTVIEIPEPLFALED